MQQLFGGLTNREQFIIYRKVWDPKKGKYQKYPCNLGGEVQDAHDRSIWVSYSQASAAAQIMGDGYETAYVFSEDDPYFFLDIDDCLVDGQWTPVALELCAMFPGAYIEVSVGGSGLHIIGTISQRIDHACRNTPNHLEFYTEGRFMALGQSDTARGSVDTIHDDSVRQLVTKYFDPTNVVTGTAAAQNSEWTTTHDVQSKPILNDDALILKAMKSVSGASVFGGNGSATFADLWTASDNLGEYFPADNDVDAFNRSVADSALATHLMFWTGGDCERTKRLMKVSGLYRDKFEREDYMLWTIAGANRTHRNGGGQYYSMTDEVVDLIEPCEQAKDLAEQIGARLAGFVKGFLKNTTLADKQIQFNINAAAIDQMITRTFWSGTKSKLYIMTDDNTLNMYVEKDMLRIAEKYFGNIVDSAEVELYATMMFEAQVADVDVPKLQSTLTAMAFSTMTDYLKMKNQRDKLRTKVDMFASRPRMEWFSDSVTTVYTWNKIPYLGAPDKGIIDDYLAHFPMFDNLLTQIVAARFASDRKNAFTWLRADSDWGKGIFTSALKDLGLLVELSVAETEKAFEGAPMAKDASIFTHAFVVCFNEFKMVKSELKQIENELPISPKNQLMQIVDIYHKLFTSAESVDSLVGEAGVEDQFANRFSYIDGRGSINERPMFNTAGKYRYYTAVKQQMAIRVTELVNGYLALGPEMARVEADRYLDHFHNKYGIGQTFERISQNLPAIIQSFKEWVIQQHSAPRQGMETVLYRDDNAYYLKSPAKVFSDWLEQTASRSERITLSKKKNDVMHMLSAGTGVKAHRISGKVVKSIRFTL